MSTEWSQPETTLTERIKILRFVGSRAYRVSPHKDGGRSSSTKSYYCQLLYGRIFDIATSILRLTDVEGGAPETDDILDPASIASLTRNLQEACDVFWYLVVERTSQEETEFRQAVWSLHLHAEALKVANTLASEYATLWSVHEAQMGNWQRTLEHNSVFSALSKKEKQRILGGRRPHLRPIENPRREAYMTEAAARAVYKYLSNHTHSHPFGVQTLSPLRWEPTFGRTYLLSACLDIAARELAMATLDYVRRMRRCDGKLPNDELDMLQSFVELPWNVRVS